MLRAWLLWAACGGTPVPLVPADSADQADPKPVDTGAAPSTSAYAALAPPRLLRRLSLDLRGTLPTVAELDAVEADPAQVWVYRDAWVDGPELEARVADILAEQWLTRVDRLPLGTTDYELPDSLEYAFERSAADEPLRLAARIVVDDAPWSEIVTSDTTVANDLLLELWPLEALETGEGWRRARYTDDRPAAGVLATNGLWWRYPTTPFNFNRTRAAATAQLLLCENYLSRPVSFTSPALLDEEGTERAVREDPGCVTCHATLDPIAAAFFGFWWYDIYDTSELTRYHAEREPLGERFLGVDTAWFGVPVGGLYDLGPAIAADPRFSRCAVETFAQGLWRREVEVADFDRISSLQAGFLDAGMSVKSLIRGVTDSPEYQAASLVPDAAAPGGAPRLLPPELLSDAIYEATGFRWTWEGFEQLRNDSLGYRTLAGGVDGDTVSQPQTTPGLGWMVATRAVAVAASSQVRADLEGAEGSALVDADLTDRPGDARFDQALAGLVWRLHGARPEADRLAELSTLWSDAAELGGPAVAWQAVIALLLQDPDFLTY